MGNVFQRTYSNKMNISYIYEKTYDQNDPILRKICEFCMFRNIPVTFREYNSVKFSEDRDYVDQLPAIQLYENYMYLRTVYMHETPVQHIQNAYSIFELQALEYKAKKQIWDEKLKHLKRMFIRDSLKTDSNSPYLNT